MVIYAHPLRLVPLLASVLLFSLLPAETSASEEISLKRKVAIARFTNETKSQFAFLVDQSGDRLGKQAADILSARLAETNKFLLFEREDVDEISAEQILNGMQKDGIPADYLIVGSVSEFGRSTESKSGVFARAKMQKAYAKVNVRLIEVSSGRIVRGFEGAGEAVSETKRTLGVGSSAGYDQSLTDKAISQAISRLVSKLVEEMTDKPWRSYLLDVDEGTYIMAGGVSQGISEAMEFNAYKKGKVVKNPQTGGSIELPGEKVARLRVLTTLGDSELNEISLMELVSGSIGSNLDEYYVYTE